jgi:predicted metalloprotease with PDZ domain
MRFPRWAVLIFMAALTIPTQAAEAVRYTLRFPAPQTHYVEVEASFPVEKRSELELFMAVWTPGSYLVREYARQVEDVRTSVGSIQKSKKNRWKIAGLQGVDRVVVNYKLYCREMSVRTNWVEANFSILNGAPTFLWPVGDPNRSAEISVDLPPGWKNAVSPLPSIKNSSTRFLAKDYDTLVDSPLYLGNATIHEFEVDGKKHQLVNEGEAGVWDGPRSVADVKKIVEQQVKMWGFAPYPRYVFFNMLTESGGGLEHKDSTVLMASRFATRSKATYTGAVEDGEWRGGWLGLVSHEFFHAWNVKRLRPVELGPFDYENENYVNTLWVAEGITSFYTDLFVARAGLLKPEEYLASVSADIQSLQSTPGRLVQSAELSSYDTWIKQYRPDENSRNTAISYYVKGAVIGFLLDTKIRQATDGKKSLDDLMRSLYKKFSGDKGFTAEEFRSEASKIAGSDFSAWFRDVLESNRELDYTPALSYYGLRFKPNGEGRSWLGADTKNADGRLLISRVLRDSPAQVAGLNVDDEIVAMDGFRVTNDSLRRRLRLYRPNDRCVLTISRRDQLMTLPIAIGTEPGKWQLEFEPQATPEQKARWANLVKSH